MTAIVSRRQRRASRRSPFYSTKKGTTTQLASGVFMNDGHGHFTFHELPRFSQVLGAAACDFSGDVTHATNPFQSGTPRIVIRKGS